MFHIHRSKPVNRLNVEKDAESSTSTRLKHQLRLPSFKITNKDNVDKGSTHTRRSPDVLAKSSGSTNTRSLDNGEHGDLGNTNKALKSCEDHHRPTSTYESSLAQSTRTSNDEPNFSTSSQSEKMAQDAAQMESTVQAAPSDNNKPTSNDINEHAPTSSASSPTAPGPNSRTIPGANNPTAPNNHTKPSFMMRPSLIRTRSDSVLKSPFKTGASIRAKSRSSMHASQRSFGTGLATFADHDDDGDMFRSDEKFVKSNIRINDDGNVMDNYGFIVTTDFTGSPRNMVKPVNSDTTIQDIISSERSYRRRQIRSWNTFLNSIGGDFDAMELHDIQRWRKHNEGDDTQAAEDMPSKIDNAAEGALSDDSEIQSPLSSPSGVTERKKPSKGKRRHRRMPSSASLTRRYSKSTASCASDQWGSIDDGANAGLRTPAQGPAAKKKNVISPPMKLRKGLPKNSTLLQLGSRVTRAVVGANMKMRRSASTQALNFPLRQQRAKHLTHLVRELGVPPRFRAQVWFEFSGAELKRKHATKSYHDLVSANDALESETARVIERDLHRTFPTNYHFQDEAVIDSLRRVLLAYSVRNSAVGYCQSMNFLVAILLLHMEEEEAFWVLAAIIEDLVPGSYSTTMTSMHIDQRVFADLVRKKLPKLHAHLEKHGFPLASITYQWFLCLYVNTLPLESTLRVWDCFLHEGYKALFRVGLAILKRLQKRVLQADNFQDIHECLTVCPRDINPQKLIKVAYDPYFMNQFSSTSITELRALHRPAVETELGNISGWVNYSSNNNNSTSCANQQPTITEEETHSNASTVPPRTADGEADVNSTAATPRVLSLDLRNGLVHSPIQSSPKRAQAMAGFSKLHGTVSSGKQQDRTPQHQMSSAREAEDFAAPPAMFLPRPGYSLSSTSASASSIGEPRPRAPRRLSTSASFTYSYKESNADLLTQSSTSARSRRASYTGSQKRKNSAKRGRRHSMFNRVGRRHSSRTTENDAKQLSTIVASLRMAERERCVANDTEDQVETEVECLSVSSNDTEGSFVEVSHDEDVEEEEGSCDEEADPQESRGVRGDSQSRFLSPDLPVEYSNRYESLTFVMSARQDASMDS